MNHVDIKTIDRVVLITIKRPEALNALNTEIMSTVIASIKQLDKSPDVGCFLLTGTEKAFAAGADIKELAEHDYPAMAHQDVLSGWQEFAQLRTPKIAAVNGYALGGGCELAMLCDLIFAAEGATFGQPEVKLGLIPGMGGSQRLTHLVGRAKAMDMILTGRSISAREAEQYGLVSRIYPDERLLEESLAAAQQIASYGKMATMAARDAINMAEETGISQGVLFERRIYHALWATDDAHEGMEAFLEKREATFNHRK